MEITTTVEFPNWDGPSVEGAIVKEAADKIVQSAQDDIVQAARSEVMEKIRSEIAAVVDEVVASPVQPTNRYGELTGQPTPFRELMLEETKKWLAERVDPRDGSKQSYGDGVMRSEYLFRCAIRVEMTKAYKAEIDAAIVEVKAELDGKIKDMVAEAVKNILYLSS